MKRSMITLLLLPLAFGTLLAAFIAIIVAVPMAVAVALFITFYAPRRVAQLRSCRTSMPSCRLLELTTTSGGPR